MSELTLQELAKLSDASYKEFNATKRGYLKQANKHLRLDASLTNKYITVGRDIRNNNIYISHRGTKANDFGDLSADLAILTGTEKTHSRFTEAQKHLDKVRAKYPDANIILASHSLGGTIARNLAYNNEGIEAHIFNPGSSIGHVQDSKKWKENENRSRIVTYHVGGDVVSMLGLHGEEELKIIKQNRSNPHSLSNFINHVE